MKPMSNARKVTPLWEPAVMLPAQMIDRRRLAQIPEVRLVTAMLDDAVRCIMCNVGARRGARRRQFLEARDWLWDDMRDWPFAFANVCDLLGLDATAVRERLAMIVTGQPRRLEEPDHHHATAATLPAGGAQNERGFRPERSIEMRR